MIYTEKKIHIIYLMIAIIIAILVFSNLSIFLHKKYKNPKKPQTFQAQEINITGTTKQGTHYILYAHSAKEIDHTQEYQLEQVHAVTYWDLNNQSPSYTLNSNQAHFLSNQHQLFFPANVTLTSYKKGTGKKNHTFNTSQASFNIKSHLFTSNGPAQDITNNYIANSTKGIKTFDQNKKIFFLGKTKIHMNNGSTLTSDRYFYINKEKNFYFATKHSTFIQNNINLDSQEYLSALLKKNIIEKIFAKNQVSISDKKIKASGNSLLYQKKFQIITLWGSNKNFGFFDKLESIPKVKTKFAYMTQKNIKFTARSFIAYLKKRKNKWIIDHIKAFHVIVTNHRGLTVSGRIGYYNTITKKIMVCGHANSFSKNFILHGECIISNLRSGLSHVIHKQHSKNQIKMLIFKS